MNEKQTELLEDVLTTAIEGGINYWAEGCGFQRHPVGHPRFLSYYACSLRANAEDDDAERRTWKPVTLETVQEGVRRILAGELRREQVTNAYHVAACVMIQRGDSDNVDYDAETADLILQAALFNEIVYG